MSRCGSGRPRSEPRRPHGRPWRAWDGRVSSGTEGGPSLVVFRGGRLRSLAATRTSQGPAVGVELLVAHRQAIVQRAGHHPLQVVQILQAHAADLRIVRVAHDVVVVPLHGEQQAASREAVARERVHRQPRAVLQYPANVCEGEDEGLVAATEVLAESADIVLDGHARRPSGVEGRGGTWPAVRSSDHSRQGGTEAAGDGFVARRGCRMGALASAAGERCRHQQGLLVPPLRRSGCRQQQRLSPLRRSARCQKRCRPPLCGFHGVGPPRSRQPPPNRQPGPRLPLRGLRRAEGP
mmetsp:Transcript_81094/g.235257  ORF Transcript_81094/g.235257 Transcript_81094/m.235257 type:complete len:294 (-) Transcript_81094:2-883(-)